MIWIFLLMVIFLWIYVIYFPFFSGLLHWECLNVGQVILKDIGKNVGYSPKNTVQFLMHRGFSIYIYIYIYQIVCLSDYAYIYIYSVARFNISMRANCSNNLWGNYIDIALYAITFDCGILHEIYSFLPKLGKQAKHLIAHMWTFVFPKSIMISW